MNSASRQDVQNIVEVAKNRIMDRMVTRQDVNALTDTIKNLTALHQQSQQHIRQSEYQQAQLSRRIISLEARIINHENDIKILTAAISRLMEQRPQQIIMPIQTPADEQSLMQAARHAFVQPKRAFN